MRQQLLVTILLSLFSFSLHAIQVDDHTWHLNAGSRFNFARYNIDCIPKTEGYLAGVHLDTTYTHCQRWYAQLQFDGLWNAGYVCGKDDTKSQIKDYRPELTFHYRYDFCNDRATLAPFTGVGFYYLSHEFKPNIQTYRYHNLYVPIGCQFLWHIDRMQCKDEQFHIGISAAYRIDAWTRLKVKTPAITICDKLKLTRTHGLLIETPLIWSLPYKKPCSQHLDMHIAITPCFDWNHFGRSKEKSGDNVLFSIKKLDRWHLGLALSFGAGW